MKLSTRARYGMRILLDLALHATHSPVTLKEIASRQEISIQYLEKLVRPMRTAGIVNSTRGTGGGITLTKEPSQITLLEVVSAMEGSLAPVACVDTPGVCHRSDFCATRDVWCDLHHSMILSLSSVTLKDLAERQWNKEQEQCGAYCI